MSQIFTVHGKPYILTDGYLYRAAPDMLAALILLLNVEKAALIGAEAPGLKGLDVPYHFEAARAAIARATSKD